MNLQTTIREIKHIAFLNQKEIAKILGCSQVTISRMENKKQNPTLKIALKIVNLAREYKIKVKLEDLLPKD